MPRIDSADIELTIFTFKDGLLARLAHDLRLRARTVQLDVETDAPRSLTLTVPVDQIEVETARIDDQDAPNLLSDADKDKIRRTMLDDVLNARRYPEVRFFSDRIEDESDGLRIEGNLEIAGRSHRMTARAHESGGRWTGQATVHQPDFGISPYTALFGALKIRPDVEVRLSFAVKSDASEG